MHYLTIILLSLLIVLIVVITIVLIWYFTQPVLTLPTLESRFTKRQTVVINGKEYTEYLFDQNAIRVNNRTGPIKYVAITNDGLLTISEYVVNRYSGNLFSKGRLTNTAKTVMVALVNKTQVSAVPTNTTCQYPPIIFDGFNFFFLSGKETAIFTYNKNDVDVISLEAVICPNEWINNPRDVLLDDDLRQPFIVE